MKWMRTVLALVGTLGAFLPLADLAYGALPNKSGVRPAAISLPTGPGSLEGLGESFEPNLSTGSAVYSVPLEVPPGRTGTAPELSLSYDSGRGNGILGIGWSLSSLHVHRQTDKGLPRYGAGPVPDSFVTGDGAELVRVEGDADSSQQVYRLKNESQFARYVYFMEQDRWELTTRDGTRYGLGARLNGGEVNARVAHPDVASAAYAWHVAEVRDLNGNQVLYRYAIDQQQVYCQEISYGFISESAAAHVISFTYESREDPVVDYRPAFRLATAQRLASIDVHTAGQLVRRYRMDYEADRATSWLRRITLTGADGITALPPQEFAYSDQQPLASSAYEAQAGLGSTALLLEGEDPDQFPDKAELIDFDGDGLPDFYRSRSPSSPPNEYDVVYRNLGGGEFERIPLAEQDSAGLRIQARRSFVRDVDGDGTADLIAQRNIDSGNLVYRLNRKGRWADEQPELVLPPGTNIEQVFTGADVRCTDLNFDKTIDSVRAFTSVGPSGSGVFFAAYTSNGDGSFDYIPQTQPDILKGLTVTFAQANGTLVMADMNGDRLADVVLLRDINAGGPRYWPSMGRGTFDDSTNGYALPLVDGPDFDGDPEQIGRLDLADLNGDGLADLLYVNGSRIRYWLNQAGTGFGAEQALLFDRIYDRQVATYRLIDVDGDGLLEVLFYAQSQTTPDYLPRGTGYVRVFANNLAQRDDGVDNDGDGLTDEADEGNSVPNMLSEIRNGFGLITSIGYGSSAEEMRRDAAAGDPWPSPVPFPLPVVTRTDRFDGLRSYQTSYAYHDGFYDGLEKEFRGFERVEQRDVGDASAPDLITASEFDSGRDNEARKGKLLRMTATDGAGTVFYSEQTTWATRTLLSGAPGEHREITYSYMVDRGREVVEGGSAPPITLRWEYEFDDFGNQTRLLEHGRLDPGWDDERLTTTTYTAAYPQGQEAWILDRVVTNTTSDENGVQVAGERHYYDDSDVLGVIVRGNETLVEAWVESDRWLNAVRRRHDEFGNVIETRDGQYGLAPGHRRQVFFDDGLKIYPVREDIDTGALTLSTNAAYDLGFGKMISSTDFNGYETLYRYDPIARLIAIVEPGDTLAAPTVEYAYELITPVDELRTINAIWTARRERAGAGTVDSRSYFDGRGEQVMVREEADVAGRVVVRDAVTFNSRALAAHQFLPYQESGTLAYQDPNLAEDSVTLAYDALGRISTTTQPDGTFRTTQYEPLAQLVHDEAQTQPGSPHFGAATRLIEDGLWNEDSYGRLRSVVEIVRIGPNGEPISSTSEWVTTYSYDLLDNITAYVDSQLNAKQVRYDGLSRVRFIDDPDRGTMQLEYDNASNLIQSTDAKGQAIRYTYDGANRLLTERYGPSDGEPDVSYHYDQPFGPVSQGEYWSGVAAGPIAEAILGRSPAQDGFDLNVDGAIDVADAVSAARAPQGTVTARNTLGQLAWLSDQSGEHHASFDERGREEWTVDRILDGEGVLRNFYSAKTYDSMDRIESLVYPDQSALAMQYGPRGLLAGVATVVDSIQYNAAEQIESMTLGNGVVTTRSYDSRRRLVALRSVRDSLTLQDLSYDLDAVSNVRGITDLRSNAALDAIGSELGLSTEVAREFDTTQTFEFDSLYRLTRAENPSVFGHLDYRYDQIGNLVLRDGELSDAAPFVAVGELAYGGAAGSSGRSGRSPGAPPGPHALTSAGEEAYTLAYDDNGNTSQFNDAAYGWDEKDRLITLSEGTSAARYTYDHANQRKLKEVITDGALAERVLYVNRYSEVRNGELRKYVYVGDARVARAYVGQSFAPEAYFLHDHLGSLNLTLQADGTVAGQRTYYPYGQTRLAASSDGELSGIYQFTGKERDQESGLMYFGERYFNHFGRFASVDPADHFLAQTKDGDFARAPQSLNSYRYAANNPVTLIDRLGRAAERPDSCTAACLNLSDEMFDAMQKTTMPQQAPVQEVTPGSDAHRRFETAKTVTEPAAKGIAELTGFVFPLSPAGQLLLDLFEYWVESATSDGSDATAEPPLPINDVGDLVQEVDRDSGMQPTTFDD
ncbi:MAG: SpvB/TcaC N-terminal domain-containing protein [Pseudomonadota bacterium]